MTTPWLTTFGAQPVGQVLSIKAHMTVTDKAVFRFEQTTDGPQGRGLAGAVGAQQGHDITLGYAQTHPAKDLDNVVVNHLDIVDFKQARLGSRLWFKPVTYAPILFFSVAGDKRIADSPKNPLLDRIELYGVHAGMIVRSKGDWADGIAGEIGIGTVHGHSRPYRDWPA